MAKQTRKTGARQQKKPSRTIDLEANKSTSVSPVKDDKATASDANSVAGTHTKGKDSKPATGTESKTPSSPKASGTESSAKNVTNEKSSEKASTSKASVPGTDTKPSSVSSAKPVSSASPAAKSEAAKTAGGGQQSRGSFLSMILAAIFGGAIALGGQMYLQSVGIGGTGEVDPGGAVAEGELAEIRQSAESAQAVALETNDTVQQLEARLSELNQQLLSGEGDVVSGDEVIRSALSGELETIRSEIADIRSSMGAGSSGETGSEALTELQAQVSKLQDDLSAGSAVDTEAFTERLNATEAAVEELKGDMDALSGRIGAVETTLNEQVAPQMEQVGEAAAIAMEGQKVARSIAARALDSAIDQGGRFMTELDTAETFLGNTETVAALRPIAQSGVASLDELKQSFDQTANVIIDVAAPVEEDSMFSQFMQSARSLVKVRPAGPVEGDSAEAIVSRMEASLQQGDLENVVVEWETLSDDGKAASQEFIAAVRTRIEAKRLAEALSDQLRQGAEG